MNPTRARVRNYKCIADSGWVEIDDLTCLIGKNESGKTVLMEAISQLNPARDREFTPRVDYPRRQWPEYKRRHDTDPDPVVSVEFALTDAERARLADRGGRAVDDTVVVTKNYANERSWDIEVDESTYLDWVLSNSTVPPEARSELRRADSVGSFHATITSLETDETLDALADAVPESRAGVADEIAADVLSPALPEFHYVGEYSSLDPSIDLDAFVDRVDAGDATAADRIFESLLAVADLDVESLRTDDWRDVLTELETASNEVTTTVTRYWSQSDDIEVRLRPQEDADGRTIEVRVQNPHHGVTVEFDQRSNGFRWFFSTFCTLLALRDSEEEIVLLLDEPGLHLHPKAKREFLTFLDEEIAADGSLIYSTHSPFMIDLDRAHRTRMLHKDPETGSTVLSDPDEADAYTRYPLQNTFELGVMETMASRSQLLLVEDGTTYEYLYNVSELLEDTDAPVLDRGWTVLPIGSLENTSTVRSVFDTGDREVAVVHDGTNLVGWEPPADVTVVGIGSHAPVGGAATIEDVLSEAFYLELVNRTYAADLSQTAGVPDRVTSEDLAEYGRNAPIVERLDGFFEYHGIDDGSFDRRRPAQYLQRHREDFAAEVDMDTRKFFGSLSRELNRTLGTFDGTDTGGSILRTLFGN